MKKRNGKNFKKNTFIGSLIGATLALSMISSNSYAMYDKLEDKILLEPIINSIEERANKLYGNSFGIPARYDLREYIDIEVRDQGWTNQCWAFSATSMLSAHLSYLYNEEYLFSPRHMDYATSTTFTDGTNVYAYEDREVDEGGHADIMKHYWLSGLGPILEEDMPFSNDVSQISLSELPMDKAVKSVEEVAHIPSVYKEWVDGELVYTDVYDEVMSEDDIKEYEDSIKQIIMDYGAISAGLAWDSKSFGENGSYNITDLENALGWHGITVIGWDDTYSKNNFNNKPTRDGAWLALNSYGESEGDNGYIHISYEDLSFDMSNKTYVIDVVDIDYDNAYLSFEDAKNSEERLTQISILMDSVLVGYTTCSITIDGTEVATNYMVNKGINTINLETPIQLTKDSELEFVYNMNEEYRQYFKEYYYTLGESSMSLGEVNTDRIFLDSGLAFEITTNHNVVDNGNNVNVIIMNTGLGTDCTQYFDINGTTIENNKANIVIEPNENCVAGQYKIILEYGEVTEELIVDVQQLKDGYKMITFDSKAIYDEIKYQFPEDIWSLDDKMMIYAEEADIESIDSLMIWAIEDVITNLSGLENFTNLKTLQLRNILLADISPIVNLVGLTDIELRKGKVDSIKGISNLVNLESLILNDLELVDISELGSLTKLTELEIEDNNISDISSLSSLTNLTWLKTKYNKIENLKPIETLTKLEVFETEYNNISDITVLSRLTNLERLILNDNKISDISALSTLSNLKYLYVDYNYIEDITPIIEMIQNSEKIVNFGGQIITREFSMDRDGGAVDGVEIPKIFTNLKTLDANSVYKFENCEEKDGKLYFSDDLSTNAYMSLTSDTYGAVRIDMAKTNILDININSNQGILEPGETVDITVDLTNHKFNAFVGTLEYNTDIFELVQADDFKTKTWSEVVYNPSNKMFITDSNGNKGTENVFVVTLKVKENIPGSIYTTIGIKDITFSDTMKEYYYNDTISNIRIVSKNQEIPSEAYVSYNQKNDNQIEVSFDLDSFGANALYGKLEYDTNVFEEVTSDNFVGGIWDGLEYNPETKEFVINGKQISSKQNIFKLVLTVKEGVGRINTVITFKDLNTSNGEIDIYLTDKSIEYFNSVVTIREFTVVDNYITNVPTGMTYAEFITYIDGAIKIELYDKNGNVINDNNALVGTGMEIVINGKAYTIIVRGDISGDGKLSVLDLSRVSLSYVKLLELTQLEAMGADMNSDNKVSITDLSQMKMKIVHLID